MKINAIGTDYSAIRAKNARGAKAVESQPQGIDIPKGMSMISFKGGNKGDVLHVIAEVDPSFTTGGVATVGKDYKSLNNISKTEHGRTVIFTPYYNGNIQYDSESGELIKSVDVLKVPSNLPEGHPMKNKAGTPFFTKEDLSAKITALEQERYAVRLKIRRAKAPEEDAALKEQAEEITKQITPLRKQRDIARRIEEHIPKIHELLEQERNIEMKRNNLIKKKERGYER